jgi:hypothetical protein
MNETTKIGEEVARRGISRLCHFTSSRNLLHIAKEGKGLLSTAHLKTDERLVYNPTDLERLDGHPEHVCCSLQYPNAWYLQRARAAESLFKDWVVLLIDTSCLTEPGTLFCARNAAAGAGRFLMSGIAGFNALFAPSVLGAYNRTYTRSAVHFQDCPTDNQAEVLIKDGIEASDIIGVAVQTEDQAQTEWVRLKHANVQGWSVPFFIAPDFYNPSRLSSLISSGQRPKEMPWDDNEVLGN